MSAAIPQVAIVALATGAGALALSRSQHRVKYLIGGGILVGASLAWNAYIEAKLIQQVISAGAFYAAKRQEQIEESTQ